MMNDWLTVERGEAPLIVSAPHAGLGIPDELADSYVSPDLARADADFHIERVYAFARNLGATSIHTAISRSVIDVNRDPSGASLYPGMATTELCPTTRFDGTPLYREGRSPDAAEIARRRALYFDPFHAAIRSQIARLRQSNGAVVLYDAHSILSRVPRLFEGELAQFNIGAFGGRSCAQELVDKVAGACAPHGSCVVDGRFKGGWITRHYGDPGNGVHAIQMELAMRGYLDENGPWPPDWDEDRARPMQAVLRDAFIACLDFVKKRE
jgi:formiminoglutamase